MEVEIFIMEVEITFYEKLIVQIKKHFDENINDDIIHSAEEFFRVDYLLYI